MYPVRSFRLVSAFAFVMLGMCGFAAAAEADAAADAYRAAERAARAQYMSELETARTHYGEGTPEYQNAVNQASGAYRDRLAAATAANPSATVTPEPIPFPDDVTAAPVYQEPTDWQKFKGASKEAGTAIGEGAGKAGNAVERGAKRVGRFFKEGYEDIVDD